MSPEEAGREASKRLDPEHQEELERDKKVRMEGRRDDNPNPDEETPTEEGEEQEEQEEGTEQSPDTEYDLQGTAKPRRKRK